MDYETLQLALGYIAFACLIIRFVVWPPLRWVLVVLLFSINGRTASKW